MTLFSARCALYERGCVIELAPWYFATECISGVFQSTFVIHSLIFYGWKPPSLYLALMQGHRWQTVMDPWCVVWSVLRDPTGRHDTGAMAVVNIYALAIYTLSILPYKVSYIID